MRRPFVRALLAVLAMLGAPGASGAPRARALPPLLAKSERLVDLRRVLRKWADPRPDVFNEPIWLSDAEALTHANYANGRLSLVYRIDVVSGRTVELRRLSARLNAYRWGDWGLSDDRRWLLWLNRMDPTPPRWFVATRVDGSRSISWPSTSLRSPGPAIWIPRTHRWVNLRSYNGRYVAEARFHDVERPSALRRVSLKGLHIAPEFVARTPDGRVLTTRYDESGRAVRVPLSEFSLLNPARLVRRWSVAPPLGGTVRRIAASPDGRRLAWLVDTPRHRYDRPCRGQTVWVSDRRGRHMRLLGAVPCEDGTGIDEYKCFDWLPSGKRLVFFHDRVLYAVRARP